MSQSAIDLMAIQVELHDLHIVHAKALMWRMRCLAHRLLTFGWEDAVQTLSVVELLVLSANLPPYMGDVLIDAAYGKADPRWKAFIERTAPRLAPEAV